MTDDYECVLWNVFISNEKLEQTPMRISSQSTAIFTIYTHNDSRWLMCACVYECMSCACVCVNDARVWVSFENHISQLRNVTLLLKTKYEWIIGAKYAFELTHLNVAGFECGFEKTNHKITSKLLKIYLFEHKTHFSIWNLME